MRKEGMMAPDVVIALRRCDEGNESSLGIISWTARVVEGKVSAGASVGTAAVGLMQFAESSSGAVFGERARVMKLQSRVGAASWRGDKSVAGG